MNMRAEWAKRTNAAGVNCAQSIALAYQDLVDVSPRHLCQMAEGFGGGMGKMQETCGLLTGLYMLTGLLFSSGDTEKGQTKLQTYEKIRALHHAFRQELGSAHCYILLGGTEPSHTKCRDKFDVACAVFEKLLADNNIAVPAEPEFIKNQTETI